MRRGSSGLIIIFGLFLLLVAGAGVALMAFGQQGDGVFAAQSAQLPPTDVPTVSVVKAEIDLAEGTVISSTSGLLTLADVPVTEVVPGVTLTSIEEARNMVLIAPISANETLRTDMLRKAGLSQKIPAPKAGEQPVKAFPIQVNSLSGVADLIQPGDFVDVLASFNMDVVTFRPGGVETQEDKSLKYIITEQASNEGSAKILLQDVEVLDVIKPAPPAEGEEGTEEAPPPPPSDGTSEGAAPPPPTAGNTLNTGNWIIVVAVTNQEAEVLRFALDRGIGITTVLRRAGDHTTERTVGATMRILVDNYGMPMPSFPQVAQQPSAGEIPGAVQLPQVEEPAFVPTVTAPEQ